MILHEDPRIFGTSLLVTKEHRFYPSVTEFVRDGYRESLSVKLTSFPDTYLVQLRSGEIVGAMGYGRTVSCPIYTAPQALNALRKHVSMSRCCEQSNLYGTSPRVALALTKDLMTFARAQGQTHGVVACTEPILRIIHRIEPNTIHLGAVDPRSLSDEVRQNYGPWLEQNPQIHLVPCAVRKQQSLAA